MNKFWFYKFNQTLMAFKLRLRGISFAQVTPIGCGCIVSTRVHV